MACSLLTLGINPGCAALQKLGGLNKRVYLLDKANLASYTIDGTSKMLTTIVMESTTKLYKFISKDNAKQAYKADLVVGANVNVWNHVLDMVLYADTQLELNAVRDLCRSSELYAIVQRNSGEFFILGLDIESGNLAEPEGGLMATAGTMSSGITLQDDTSIKISLSGEVKHTPIRTFVAATQTLEIAYFDALC